MENSKVMVQTNSSLSNLDGLHTDLNNKDKNETGLSTETTKQNLDIPKNNGSDTTENRINNISSQSFNQLSTQFFAELKEELTNLKESQQQILSQLNKKDDLSNKLENITKCIQDLVAMKDVFENEISKLRNELTSVVRDKEEFIKKLRTGQTPYPQTPTSLVKEEEDISPRPKRKYSFDSVEETPYKKSLVKTPKQQVKKPKTPKVTVGHPKVALEEGDTSLIQDTKLIECHKVLMQLKRHRFGYIFNVPVDPVALNIPDYFDIIKNPMDFGTIQQILESGEKITPDEFIDKVNLVFSNALTYNPPGSDVNKMALTLRELFYQKMKKVWTLPPMPVVQYQPPAIQYQYVGEEAPKEDYMDETETQHDIESAQATPEIQQHANIQEQQPKAKAPEVTPPLPPVSINIY
jgi:hypothetical protein